MRLIIEFPKAPISDDHVYPHSLYVFIHSIIAAEHNEKETATIETLIFNDLFRLDSYHTVDNLVYVSAKSEEAIVRIVLAALTKFVHTGLVTETVLALKCAKCKTIEQLAQIWAILVFNELAPSVEFHKQYLFDVHWNTPGCTTQMQPMWGTSRENVHMALFNLYGIVEISETHQLEH